MENKEFDEMIAQQLSQRKIEAGADAWEKIESQLDEKKAFPFSKIGWAAAVILLIGLTLLFKWEKTDTTITDLEKTTPIPSMEDVDSKKPLEKSPVVTHEERVSTIAVSNKKGVKTSPEKISTTAYSPIINHSIEKIAVLTNTVKIPELTENKQLNLPEKTTANRTLETEVNYSQLVMKQLNRSKTSISVDAKDLMQLTESEMHTNKTIRQVIVEKFKNTVQDLPIALK